MKKFFGVLIILLAAASFSNPSWAHSSKKSGLAPSSPEAVYFDVGAASIKDEESLNHNAQWLKSNKDKVVILEGHCDARGSREYNLHLGDRRARTVMQELMSRGVPESQLIIVSYGKDRPLVKGASEEAFSQNRRVELVLR